jgi:hypothetical protein
MALNVRRLAAIDLHGMSGTTRRFRLVRAEFLTAVPVALFIATALMVNSGPVGKAIGVWLVGVGLNYVPLAAYALRFSNRAKLDAELANIDLRSEIRHYTAAQLWILVPMALVIFAASSSTPPR